MSSFSIDALLSKAFERLRQQSQRLIISNLARAIKQLHQLDIDDSAALPVSSLGFSDVQEALVQLMTKNVDVLAQMAVQPQNLPELENALNRLQGIVDKSTVAGFSGVEQKTVFHGRIDRHFTELELCHYKKFHNLKITKIARINLFTGINNSGKTTLLEAVYLLSKQNDFGGLLEVIRRRGKVSEDKLNPEWFLQQLPESFALKARFDNQDTSVAMRHYEEDSLEIDRARYSSGIINAPL
jgi:hypothetical protein